MVAAFETIAYRFEMPDNKAHLIDMLNSGVVVTFRFVLGLRGLGLGLGGLGLGLGGLWLGLGRFM